MKSERKRDYFDINNLKIVKKQIKNIIWNMYDIQRSDFLKYEDSSNE